MADLYVIDTHVLIWYFIGSPRLSLDLKTQIDEIRNRNGRLLIPTIVLAEAFYIAEKGKVQFDFVELYRLIREHAEFAIVGFGTEIFDAVIRVHDVPELHDRIIVATARFYDAGILTKDQVIREAQAKL
jgi:PIN domain nuclease of toxin-antitoxin system